MEKGRKLVLGIGIVVLIVIGWIAWITFVSPANIQMSESVVSSNEMVILRHDLTDFIVERMKKERAGSELIDIALQSPIEDAGKIKVPYTLEFKEPKAGTTATIQATALLEREGSQYKVIKVIPQKETITYDDSNSIIKADSTAK